MNFPKFQQLVEERGGGRPLDDAPKIIPRGYRLGESYLVRAEPILKKQMARASVRLANELNAIFK